MGKRLSIRLAVVTVGAAACVLAAPGVASANTVTVSPNTVSPGGKITVHVTCKKAGDHKVDIFWGRKVDDPKDSRTVRLRKGTAAADFTIPRGTRPGTYVAGTFCPNDTFAITDHFTVAPHGAPPAGGGPGGDGGAVTLAGAGALAVATMVGAFLLLRRRADGTLG